MCLLRYDSNTFCVMKILNGVCLLPFCSLQLNFAGPVKLCCCVMYCCSWGTRVPVSHYGYHLFGIAEHANVGLRTKTVCSSCLCFSCFLTALIHFQAISYMVWFLVFCAVEGGKGRLIKNTVGSSKEKRTEGVGSFRFWFFLTGKKCSTSYWESSKAGCVGHVWREDRDREHTDVAAAEYLVHAGSHGCAQLARAASALQSCAPVAFRMLASLEVYCLNANMLFLLHKMRVWNKWVTDI